LGKGFEKAKIDGKLVSLRDRVELSRHKKHDIDALVDEILISEFVRGKGPAVERLSEAVERALQEADGLVKIEEAGTERIISSKFMCAYDGFSFPEVEPRLFSFNSPYGACPRATGLAPNIFGAMSRAQPAKASACAPRHLTYFLAIKQTSLM